MRITEIFLDMDGVLCNFNSVYKRKFGMTPSQVKAERDRKEYGHFWSRFVRDREFERLPMLDGAKELLDYVNSKNIPISILSSSGGAPYHEEVLLQKYVWLDNHNITYPRNIVAGRSKKKEYAHKGALLIDDTPQVITEFRIAGGHGVLWTESEDLLSKLRAVDLYFKLWNDLNKKP